MDTSLIDVDVQPSYARVTVKGKVRCKAFIFILRVTGDFSDYVTPNLKFCLCVVLAAHSELYNKSINFGLFSIVKGNSSHLESVIKSLSAC